MKPLAVATLLLLAGCGLAYHPDMTKAGAGPNDYSLALASCRDAAQEVHRKYPYMISLNPGYPSGINDPNYQLLMAPGGYMTFLHKCMVNRGWQDG